MLKIRIYLHKFNYQEEFFDVFSTDFNKVLNSVESILWIKNPEFYTKFFYYDCLNLVASHFSRKNKYY